MTDQDLYKGMFNLGCMTSLLGFLILFGCLVLALVS